MKTDHMVLDLVRLGIAGDSDSLRLFARRLLRNPPAFIEDKSAFVEALTGILKQAPARGVRGMAAPVAERGTSSLLGTYEPHDTRDPLLASAERAVIEAIVEEREHAGLLSAGGIEPTRTLLLTGPPGVGKTMTAHYIAKRLGLPLFRIDLAVVISSFLGKTGQNLKAALDHAKSQPSVLLLDEFDALAKRRDDASDVGELKRIVNVLLVELEHWRADGLLVAATNHPGLLDPAIWRRFDRVLPIGLPSHDDRSAIAMRILNDSALTISSEGLTLLTLLSSEKSGSETVRLARTAARSSLLSGARSADAAVFALAKEQLKEASQWNASATSAFCELAHAAGLPQRSIAALLGVSHVTVGRILRRRTSSASSNRS